MASIAKIDELKKLKIADLRKELTERGLTSKGNKAELLERLSDFLETAGVDAVLDDPVDEDAEAVLNADDDAEGLLSADVDLEDGDVDADEDLEATRKVDIEPDVVESDAVEPEQKAVEVKKIVMPPVTAPKTDVEKKAIRAQKFGVSAPLSDADKKKARAERFGMPTGAAQNKPVAQSKGIAMSVSQDKLQQRAERFGKSVSPTAIKNEEAERIRKRKERFGVVTAVPAGTKAKISGDGDDDADAKKRKRAERFGMA